MHRTALVLLAAAAVTLAGCSSTSPPAPAGTSSAAAPSVDPQNAAQKSARWTAADDAFLHDLGATALGAEAGSPNAYQLVVAGLTMCQATSSGSSDPAHAASLPDKWTASAGVIMTTAWMDLCPDAHTPSG